MTGLPGTRRLADSVAVLFRWLHTLRLGAKEVEIAALVGLQDLTMVEVCIAAILAQANDDADWKTVLPPLVSLSPAAEAQLHASLDALGFASNSLLEAETSSAAD